MAVNIDHIIKAADGFYDEIHEEWSSTIKRKYDNKSKTFAQLNKWKDEELPETLKQRYEEHGKVWITKQELINLIDLKLAKGTFRPMIPKLIKQNEEEDVESSTTAGFQALLDFIEEHKDPPEDFWAEAKDEVKYEYADAIEKSFESFCELRGVGPSAASLLASLLVKISPTFSPPYFSDEGFSYYVLDAYEDGEEKKIKFDTKEYVGQFLPVFFELVTQHPGLTFDKLEKGAWALKVYQKKRTEKLENLEPDFDDDQIHSLVLDFQPNLDGRPPKPKKKRQKKA
ncbi:hypothetical protein Cantr_00747 [Candida viswanathii]|uniref:Uncharacterized protein n=1 Tax=Candida viswanathii TaxID=5486 RepID=A0A367YGI8_9ASCO|nr:hypothetical protein Cantr_00747 [Candida viswanathii]